ncbi:hypothetical protein NDU88_001572 [Pleurodeles waltl]|uniref:Uncharacterized protein n=1 Tax=Pleurodeles waltl TaxID=8319 RepID=A0AAV7U8V6_PLEWA|nr:hypothetical protein NDU88_001572 [Pleurodeles waltl]
MHEASSALGHAPDSTGESKDARARVQHQLHLHLVAFPGQYNGECFFTQAGAEVTSLQDAHPPGRPLSSGCSKNKKLSPVISTWKPGVPKAEPAAVRGYLQAHPPPYQLQSPLRLSDFPHQWTLNISRSEDNKGVVGSVSHDLLRAHPYQLSSFLDVGPLLGVLQISRCLRRGKDTWCHARRAAEAIWQRTLERRFGDYKVV